MPLNVEPEEGDGVGVDDAPLDQVVQGHGLDADEVVSLDRIVFDPAGADAVLAAAPPFPGEACLAGARGSCRRDDRNPVVELAQRERRPQHLAVLGIRLDCDAALESMEAQSRHDRRSDVRPDVDDRSALSRGPVLPEHLQRPLEHDEFGPSRVRKQLGRPLHRQHEGTLPALDHHVGSERRGALEEPPARGLLARGGVPQPQQPSDRTSRFRPCGAHIGRLYRPAVTDLAVIGMDPAFGGGAKAQTDAFLTAAAALGRKPELLYCRMPSGLRRLDAGNQLAFAFRVAPQLRDARDVWIAATSASSGYGAVRNGRPYSCWIGTGLADEWAGRRPGLRASRRLALRVNGPILRQLERRVLQGAKHVYATSPWSRASVARAGRLPEEAVGILPIPVDLETFAPASDDEWRTTLEAPVLAFVGRADDTRKNVGLLIDALRLLPGVRALLVGSPPAGPLPDRVEATGPVSSVAPQLRRATLFVLPSHQEGFGIAAAEALAAGLPVVTTPSGGPEALVRESGGGVVLGGFTPDELASTVGELLADPARLEEMRRRGREYVVREHSPRRFRGLLAEALGAL